MKWGSLHKNNRSDGWDQSEYVEEFFKKIHLPSSWDVKELNTKLDTFMKQQVEAGRRIAVVTSGSTKVAMDGTGLHYIDCASSGDRGAGCAEGLLRRGYAVVFIHRDGSLLPFSRHFSKRIKNGAFMNLLKIDPTTNNLTVDTTDEGKTLFCALLNEYQASQELTLQLSFENLEEYLYLLRAASCALNMAQHRGMLFLTAAVMNFYVPESEIRADRLHNSDNGYTMNLFRSPNLRRMIRRKWCPKAFIVTFRLELTQSDALELAHRDMETWGSNVVVGNDFHTRKDKLVLVTEQEDIFLHRPENGTIETPLVSTVTKLHRDFLRQSVVLRKSKELMLLSAKFAMMKENDVLTEDADGNKNVLFRPGVRIMTNRRLGTASPIYELKSIYQNKSHSARAHIWEKCNNPQIPEVLVVFSPAGTPDTIGDLWGDFWSGWADAEVAEFKDRLSSVSLSSAIDVVASPWTGDFTSTTAALQYIWTKVGAAWSDGEQTRIRQSLQNVLALGLHRGLEEYGGLRKVEEIALSKAPSISRSSTLTVDHVVDLSEEMISAQLDRHLDEHAHEAHVTPDPLLLEAARVVRVHATVASYFRDMLNDGITEDVLAYVKKGANVNITGYSMGGMISQLFMLKLGEEARVRDYDLSKLQMIGFGTPRIGDSGFCARLKLMFCPSQLINVMHPSDTVHAFPPTSEGYEDAMLKVFLRHDGLGVGRRNHSFFSALPAAKSIDQAFERIFMQVPLSEQTECAFCQGLTHSSEQHRCRYCTQRGDHRGVDCPNRDDPCGLCGNANHCTGEHKCRVCSQHGHRGRECHIQQDVGITELISYFRFHNFLYYNTVFKQSAEFYT